jgi:hypothetical protein
MNYIKKLHKEVRLRNQQNGFSESDVMYLHGKSEISIDEFSNIKPYSAQAHACGNVAISFSKYPYHIRFSNTTTVKNEDKESYEKYGGLIYVHVPMTNEHAKVFLKYIK